MTNDPHDFPLPNPDETPWLETFLQLYAIGAVQESPVIAMERDEPADDAGEHAEE